MGRARLREEGPYASLRKRPWRPPSISAMAATTLTEVLAANAAVRGDAVAVVQAAPNAVSTEREAKGERERENQ